MGQNIAQISHRRVQQQPSSSSVYVSSSSLLKLMLVLTVIPPGRSDHNLLVLTSCARAGQWIAM